MIDLRRGWLNFAICGSKWTNRGLAFVHPIRLRLAEAACVHAARRTTTYNANSSIRGVTTNNIPGARCQSIDWRRHVLDGREDTSLLTSYLRISFLFCSSGQPAFHILIAEPFTRVYRWVISKVR